MGTKREDIRRALEVFWDDRALPSAPDGAVTVGDLAAPVESLTAVEVLVELDAIVGKKLPSSLIQPGGYHSREEFVELLSNKVIEALEAEK